LKYGISDELTLVLEKVGKHDASKRSIPRAKEFLRKKPFFNSPNQKYLRRRRSIQNVVKVKGKAVPLEWPRGFQEVNYRM
jgi:hypothetical protein